MNAAGLCRPVRHRPRHGCCQPAREIFAEKMGSKCVHEGRFGPIKPLLTCVNIGAGGGTRTLFSYLIAVPKSALAAERHNRNSRQLTVTVPKMCPRCAHGRNQVVVIARPSCSKPRSDLPAKCEGSDRPVSMRPRGQHNRRPGRAAPSSPTAAVTVRSADNTAAATAIKWALWRRSGGRW
jgi:hypothetical protein